MKTVALGKVAKIDRTVANDDECLSLPYVGLEHVEKESGHFANDFVPTPLNMLATNFRFTPKHVLYGKLRPYLNKVVLPNFDGVCTTEILPILPNEEKLDRTFLWTVLLSPAFVSWATSQISGANLPRLDPKLLVEYEIPLPPLTEQKRIASLLARADRLRQLRRTAHDLSDSVLQSVFLEMFGDPLKHYQEKWKSVRFEEITTRITYGFTNPMSHLSSGIPIITGKNVLDGQIDFENVHYADQKEYDALTLKNKPNKGDILITKDGTIGRCAIVDVDFPICINQSVALIQLNEKVIPKYVFGYLYSSSVREFLDDMKKGVALQHLQITEFAQIPIPLPPLDVQEEFAGVVARVEGLRSRMSEAGRQAEGLFESLLNEAFDG